MKISKRLRALIRCGDWPTHPERDGLHLMRDKGGNAVLVCLLDGAVADDHEFAAAMGISKIDPPELNYYLGMKVEELRADYKMQFLYVGSQWRAARKLA